MPATYTQPLSTLPVRTPYLKFTLTSLDFLFTYIGMYIDIREYVVPSRQIRITAFLLRNETCHDLTVMSLETNTLKLCLKYEKFPSLLADFTYII